MIERGSARTNFWLALLSAIMSAGFWKVLDHQIDMAERVIRIEGKVDVADRVEIDHESRLRQLERAHP